MPDFLFSALGFVVAISLLVAVHEYGHFWVARRLGFKVLRFSVGFGRPLLRWRSKDADAVEYWISAIPLGGYVKMLDEREGDVPAHEVERAFNRRPAWARIAVLFAGPAANFVFAILAFWALYIAGVASIRPYVEAVEPGSVAAESGLRADDVVLAVGGVATPTIEQAQLAIVEELLGDGIIELDVVESDGRARELALDVRGRVSELTAPDALFDGLGIVIGPLPPAIIGTVDPDTPASAAGLREGDRVVAVDGTPIHDWIAFSEYIAAHPDHPVAIEIERGGVTRSVAAVPAAVEDGGRTIGRLGLRNAPDPRTGLAERLRSERRYGPVEALGVATAETWDMSVLTTRFIWRMLTGEVSLRNASGPVMIAAYAGDYIQAGATWFLRFLAVISISLGIMNLLPVPILDGGQIVMTLIERIKGSPLPLRAAVIGQQIGLAMLVALMGVVFYNDITRLLGL
jgi:regulator of sigma E protease